MNRGHAIPAFRVTLDGRDLTDRIAPRLLSLTLTENRAGEADQLDLQLTDHDGALALPHRGAEIRLALGWQHSGIVEKGLFRVDEVEHSGAPDAITLRARSADLTADMRLRRERSWDTATLGDIVRTLAGDHGLAPQIAPTLADIAVPHLDQTESDIHLLTRLGHLHDAVATIKAGRLLFAPVGQGTTASGAPLPVATLHRRDGDSHRYLTVDRDTYSGVRAYWHDQDGADRKGVLVGGSGNAKRLRDTYPSEAEAMEAARAEWARIQRGAATLSYNLALGRPDLYPEQRVRVLGIKPDLDTTDWLVAKVTHSLAGGFTTSIEMETANEDTSVERE